MRKLLRTLALTIGISALWLVFGTILANAERVRSMLPDRTLVVKEVTSTEVLRVKNVPVGISDGQADSLAIGQLEKVIIRDEIGEKISSFALPWIKSRTMYTDKKVLYLGGWITQHAPNRFTALRDDFLLSIVWLWIPAIFIAIASTILLLLRTRKLFVFYITLLAAVLVSAVTGMFAGKEAGSLAGLVIGWWIVGFSSGSLRGTAIKTVAFMAGVLAGILACCFAGIFAGEGNFKIVVHYLLFLIAIEIVSFVIYHFAKVMYLAYAERKRKRALAE